METDIDAGGTRLAATVEGEGPRTLVWGHGLLSDRASEDDLGLFDWARVVDGTRLVRYDARGHGRSHPAGDPEQLRWSALAGDMLAVADAVGATSFVAGGASMGCATALYSAVAQPTRIEALVLVIPPTAWATRAAQAQMYAAGVELFRQQPEQALQLIASAFDNAPPLGEMVSAGYPEATEIMRRHMLRLDPSRLPSILEGAARSDLPAPEHLAGITAPALILAWVGDSGHPVATAQRLHELIADSQLHVAQSVDDVHGWPELVAHFL